MDFEVLWRQRLKSILEQIATGETDYAEVANLAEHIGADYHGRFLVELLQNAEDQTTKAGISDGLAVVVRTGTHVYVLNEGLPFDDPGIRSITSAGISPKRAEDSIGNKGVGFKAVFQVSSTPEIFTSEQGGMLTAADIVAFRINHDLFGNSLLRQHLETAAHEVLLREPNLRIRLESQLGPDEMWPSLLDHLKRAAPFKFPQALSNKEFSAHCDPLPLPKRLLDSMTTLVVLPLIRDDNTFSVVESALDELASPDNIAGSALLFLRGISRLRVYDQVRKCAWLVSRHEKDEARRLANGATIVPVSTNSACVVEGGQISRTRAEWWRIRRQFGFEGDDVNSRNDEAVRIEAAVARLPAGLREIRTAHASVALPRSASNPLFPERFPVAGRMCIGLPTRMATGTPAWLDGPYHGNVARTDIDLAPDSQPYNRLIFEESVDLFWQAIEHVKAVGDIHDKQQILFWFAFSQGSLTTYFEHQNTLSSASIILSRFGNEFLAAEMLQLPEEVDGPDLESLFGHVPNLEGFGFRLPDPWLMQEGRKIIDSFTGQPCCTVPISTYVDRPEKGKSLIEMGCHLSRNAGPEWWEPFFYWLTSRLQTDVLRDQIVLPVVGGKLACPDDRVFLRPHGLPIEGDSISENDEDEEIIDDLDATLATSLRLLDEECIHVRVVNRPRDLTELARKLSPDGTAGLVRRPRRPELINDVLIPALRERVQQDPRDSLCIRLIACIGEWLARMAAQERARVHFDQLLAPTTNNKGVWVWRPAEELYLGAGWVSESNHEHLLERAYGHRIGARLPSWDDFERWVRADVHQDDEQSDRDAWRRCMKKMGVHAQPRVLVHRPRRGYFKSWSYQCLSIEDTLSCPFVTAVDLWDDYLNYLCQRSAQTCSGQTFFARPLSWIDGLEHPDTREAVIEIVLRWPEKYEPYLWTNVARQNGSDSRRFLSLWIWAIQRERWSVVPSNDGPKPMDAVWILQSDQRRRRFVDEKLLVWLPEKFNRSHVLTQALGVYSPDNAPIERITLELHQVAERLSADGSSEQATRMLVQTLYEWLQNCCEIHESGNSRADLECLLERPVPLMRGGRVKSVDLKGGNHVFLNDDPQRSPHIVAFASGFALPLSAKSSFRALFDDLQHLLGTDRVRRVSQEPIDLAFSEDTDIPGGQLLELLEQSLGASHGDIESQLAALIAYGRSEHPMDPAKQAFGEHWSRVQNCGVMFGEFTNTGTDFQALFDTRASAGPILYVASDGADKDNASRRAVNLVRQSWRVVGPGHRDSFEAFAGVLLTGRQREFLRERGIGDAEWDEVQTAIGAPLERARMVLRIVAFALWRRNYSTGSTSEFESDWDESGELLACVMHFFDIDEATTRERINNAQMVADEEEEADFAIHLGVTTAEWQDARELLGVERVQFRQTVRDFKNAVRWVAGSVAVASSRYVRLTVSVVRSVVDEIQSLDCPMALAETRASNGAVLVEVLCRAANVVGKMPPPAMTRLAKALRRQADRAPQSVQQLELRGVPRRELNHVVDIEETERNRMAGEAVESVLTIAEALALLYGETLDIAAVKDDARVLRHTKGWWANAFAALRFLKRAIALQAPRTARTLGKRRAFAAPRSRHDLWTACPELGDLNGDANGAPNPPKKQILGFEKTQSEIDADLAAGGDSEIEQKLSRFVRSDIDLGALAQRERVPLDPDFRVRRPGGAGGWRNIQRRDEDELFGYLGERFVHEHFIAAGFPDYDASCWVSENRGGYKAQTSDPLFHGCDFRYRDSAGRLTGRADAPLCFIEVKATTSDGRVPFPITINEWRLAQECHDDVEERVYVIVRVRQIQEAPEIFDVIVDPVKALQEGWLRTRDKDLYLVVGHAVDLAPAII
ncbi:MAG: DUF3883 domain-containing protein [Rhodospirillaceae bacterium]|nr:DUF3883 domain-containing protein [Rhodospirillaceae bacterium]